MLGEPVTTTFVQDIIRRSNRALLRNCLIVIVILAVAAAVGARYMYNFFEGPFPVPASQILSNPSWDNELKYYVTVKGDELSDLGGAYIYTTENGVETNRTYYGALRLRNKILLVGMGSKPSSEVLEYTGQLVPISNDVQNLILNDVYKDHPEYADYILPVMLDTGDFRFGGYIGLAIGVVVFLFCVFKLWQAVERMGDYTKHPIMRSLARMGDPTAIAQDLDTAMHSQHTELGKLHFTQNWLIHVKSGSLWAARREDVVWAYKRIVNRRGGRTYSALLFDRYGTSTAIGGGEAHINQVLNSLSRYAPWVIGGYSKEVERLYRKDRASFIAQVDQRRQQVMEQAAQQSQPTP